MTLPRYPVYIPTKGRSKTMTTARVLIEDGVPFSLVVEPSQVEEYRKEWPAAKILVLPRDGMRVVGARNWIRDRSQENGEKKHWQLDDNTYGFYRVVSGKRIPCSAGLALRACEDFTERYENVAISGLNYDMFFVPNNHEIPPFYVNSRVYSCTLFLNCIPYRWRGLYNEDSDICLQAVAGGWCTILLNAFLVKKKQTMKVAGGNTQDLYQGDGRLKMARSLERLWPGVVETHRRFQRSQHVVKHAWTYFDNKLVLKRGARKRVKLEMKLVEKQPVRSGRLRRLLKEAGV